MTLTGKNITPGNKPALSNVLFSWLKVYLDQNRPGLCPEGFVFYLNFFLHHMGMHKVSHTVILSNIIVNNGSDYICTLYSH